MKSKLQQISQGKGKGTLSGDNKAGETKEAAIDDSQPIFRGFIGGSAFITKKGFRGLSIDSLWVQNLFTSFNTDDAELASISLRSSLADVNALVEGGEFGTPFSIGEYGFYAQNQFDDQAQLLSDKERKNANNKYFLSEGEWNLVDAYLKKVAHYSNSVFETVRRGDTFAALAVKKNAFHVAIALLQNGLDPLLENEADDDLFRIAKQQYLVLTVQMKELSSVMDRAVYNPKTLKQDWHALDAQEIAIFTALEGMIDFLVELKGNLERRLVQIDNDKKVKRRCELLNEAITEFKLWNIAQEDKAVQHIKDIEQLKGFVTEKLVLYHQQQAKRKTLRETMSQKNKHVMELLALKALEDGDEKVDKSNPPQLDELIETELRDFMQGSVIDDEDEKRSDAPSELVSKSKDEFKPILGQLKVTHDTVISYR